MEDLETLRLQIDTIDQELLALLAKRFSVVSKIGVYKKQSGDEVIDKAREEQKIAALQQAAKEYEISDDFVSVVWQQIFTESYKKEA